MPWMHCSTPCWLVQYCQCADWRAGSASPGVARVAREARLSVNPAAHGRRGSCSTGCGHRCGKKHPPSALLSPAFYNNFRRNGAPNTCPDYCAFPGCSLSVREGSPLPGGGEAKSDSVERPQIGIHASLDRVARHNDPWNCDSPLSSRW
ncbi:hypothetical protein EMIHUDRAFT_249588 [Emiliania huxleyi CCMP1516]|uniref:Uncharacterized protein n=2 Tax=Emiliania huxleyi TaxID=2903 RepID=A0A0D3I7Y0_EMIH1|nr:hypothetical protein EMIHUDRAFT_249588 [Emiliania huxleyi CCMP1516]EOD07365.1 hypothetical protein EMIHUDRAFT_249588 [Emiliania huxleyi CCMP1516]|eukprot:XP_005759794.1 hypothetical protein EMIHUDRAFT_249588 [Emiliania huxleyi CCMP1516]